MSTLEIRTKAGVVNLTAPGMEAKSVTTEWSPLSDSEFVAYKWMMDNLPHLLEVKESKVVLQAEVTVDEAIAIVKEIKAETATSGAVTMEVEDTRSNKKRK